MGSIPDVPDRERIQRIRAHAAGARDWSSIPELVGLWRDILRYGGPREQHQYISRWIGADSSTDNGPMDAPPEPDARSVRLGSGQVVWLKATIQDVAVLDKRPPIDSAIFAALSALEYSKASRVGRKEKAEDLKHLSDALGDVSDFKTETLRDLRVRHEDPAMWPLPEAGDTPDGAEGRNRRAPEEGELEWYENLRPFSLWYAVALIRFFKPDFDGYPHERQVDLIVQTCARLDGLLEAIDKLFNYLEYGAKDRDTRAEVENVKRDVRAAVLRDVHGLGNVEIGEMLGLPATKADDIRRDNNKVRTRIKVGRRILEDAFGGPEDWKQRARAMRAELDRKRSLTIKERWIEETAEAYGIPADDEEALAGALAQQMGGSVERWRRTLSQAGTNA